LLLVRVGSWVGVDEIAAKSAVDEEGEALGLPIR
jgi:hypothetical protein